MKINNEKTIVDPSVVLQLGDIQRNRIVRCHTILSTEQFYNIKCTIFVEYDPKTKSPIFIDFTRQNFKRLFRNATSKDQPVNELFKLAALDSIKTAERNLENSGLCDQETKVIKDEQAYLETKKLITAAALKYQVLRGETELICVINNQNTKSLLYYQDSLQDQLDAKEREIERLMEEQSRERENYNNSQIYLDQQSRYQIQDVEQIHQVIENRAVVRPEGANAQGSVETAQVDATADDKQQQEHKEMMENMIDAKIQSLIKLEEAEKMELSQEEPMAPEPEPKPEDKAREKKKGFFSRFSSKKKVQGQVVETKAAKVAEQQAEQSTEDKMKKVDDFLATIIQTKQVDDVGNKEPDEIHQETADGPPEELEDLTPGMRHEEPRVIQEQDFVEIDCLDNSDGDEEEQQNTKKGFFSGFRQKKVKKEEIESPTPAMPVQTQDEPPNTIEEVDLEEVEKQIE